jgi:hypothetical protein
MQSFHPLYPAHHCNRPADTDVQHQVMTNCALRFSLFRWLQAQLCCLLLRHALHWAQPSLVPVLITATDITETMQQLTTAQHTASTRRLHNAHCRHIQLVINRSHDVQAGSILSITRLGRCCESGRCCASIMAVVHFMATQLHRCFRCWLLTGLELQWLCVLLQAAQCC